jgi:phosphomannomutase/phosphoglucomutase
MKINPIVFRAYDIRGIYPTDLDEEGVFKIISAFAQAYPEASRVVVARDARLSSLSLSDAVIEALLEQGRKVIDIGLAPDSLFSFCLFHYGFEAGVMVTASHNPKQYNGLILNFKGKGVIKQDIERIKGLVLEDKVEEGRGGGELFCFDPSDDYIEYVVSKIKIQRPLNIIFDPGNGSVGYLAERVFKKLGCQVKTIFGDPDGNFPHHLPDSYVETNLKDIKREVKQQGAEIGFAFDGDGDRVALIDQKGRKVSEDYCLLLLANHVLKKKRGPVVHGMRVSRVFLDEMKLKDVKTHFSVSHHNAIIEKIKQVKAVFGGEITSHYFFPVDYYLTDDAIFSALKLAEVVAEQDDFVGYLDNLPPIYATPEIFVKTSEQEKFLIIDRLKEILRKQDLSFVDVDGARIEFDNGWALARASNTSPFIKIRFEGVTKKDLIGIRKRASKIFKQAGIKL